MANYFLKYFADYINNENDNCRLEIHQIDYEGDAKEIELGVSGVVQSWASDDPRATIKGLGLEIEITNEFAQLEDFFSVSDSEFKVFHYVNGSITFVGFLVQDDFSEDYNDILHNIKLSATDNLGLLKEVPLGSIIPDDRSINLKLRNPLSEVVYMCLYSTGLLLKTKTAINIYEQDHDTSIGMLEQTLIDCQTFISGEKYNSCWNVLDMILKRFHCTLFQARGEWHIIRWGSIKDPIYERVLYDDRFNFESKESAAPGYLPGYSNFGIGQPVTPIADITRSLVRSYKFFEETFNYDQPKYLLKNWDLQSLGALLSDTTSGTGPNLIHIREYEMVDWFDGPFPPSPADYFIRVRTDALENEIDRIVVVKGGVGGDMRAVVSTGIEVSQGDKVKFSFDFKTTASQGGNINYQMAMFITDGTPTQWWADEVLGWKNGPGWLFNITSGDNSNDWHTVTIEPFKQIPIDGILYVHLIQADFSPGSTGETWMKNLKFEYTPYINESTKIKGQIHTYTQTPDIKNKEEIEIHLDSSPRNSILGTLFLPGLSGVVQKRTALWFRPGHPSERKRLGEITTTDEVFIRRKTRIKLEGSYIRSDNFSLLDVVRYNPGLTLFFIFGYLKIQFRRNTISCTLYEIGDEVELPADLTGTYTFKYIYDAK